MSRIENRHLLLSALVVLGLGLRLGLAFATGIDRAPVFGTDQYEYDNYAWNLAQGRGYRGVSPDVADQDHLTAYRPPGTSLAWAGLYRVVGHRYAAVRVAHCLLGAATIVLVYRLGRRGFGETTGLLAAAAYTVYPTALLYATELLSEPLATFCFMLYLLACLRLADRPTWPGAVAAGFWLGYAMLCRPAFMFMLPLAGVWSLWQFRGADRRRAMAVTLAVPALAVVVLVPWAARNYQVFHTFIPFSTMGGSVLLQGNNRIVADDPLYQGYSVWDTDLVEYRDALRSAGDEVERDRRAQRFAVRWLRDNPDRWLPMAGAKLLRGWTPLLQPHSPRLYRLGTLLSWGPVVVLLALSYPATLVACLRSRNPAWIIHLAILTYAITNVIFFGNSRYRYPIEPLCLILAARGVDVALSRLGRRGGLERPATDTYRPEAAGAAP
jgi:4-amino-4-deoxy-L-arabinose transferase-like glycosyltransferase